MNGILKVKKTTENDDMKKAFSAYSVVLHDHIREAFQAAEEGDYEKAEGLCCRLLDYKANREIAMLLGACYFVQNKMQVAEMVFHDLVCDDPEDTEARIYLGMTMHTCGRFDEAVKELGALYPPKQYYPFYYTSYGDSLQQTGNLKLSRDVFYEEAAHFKETGDICSPVRLDGAFENLLYLDIVLGNGRYPEDVKLYYDFLDQIEMTEDMQEVLAQNIVYFCSLLVNRWYRPLFSEFIAHIRDRGFLSEAAPARTLESAFESLESFVYHDDRQISALTEEYLSACYERKYTKEDMQTEEDRNNADIRALVSEWYMCRYALEHPAQIEHIREKYPYSYAAHQEFLEKIREDAAVVSEKIEDELYLFVKKETKQEMIAGLNAGYDKACENKKETAAVYDSEETYRRMQPKVGRNDPCPCGSGKKYKKCCGK